MPELSKLGQGSEPYSPEYTFVRGQYAIGEERLPYFAVSMSIDDASKYLTFAREVVFDPAEPVDFEELIQREVDQSRTAIDNYLIRDNRVKFFNSFTVVLLPVEPGNQARIQREYPPSGSYPVDQTDAAYSHTDVGTIFIRRLIDHPDVGFLKWNTNRVKPVLIDGQHRYQAIKRLLEDERFRAKLRPAETRIPVIFLVLDERADFVAPSASQKSVLAACRSVFIDLNKHARPVAKARQYLLDDRDLTAVAMRSILSRQIGVSLTGDGDPSAVLPAAERVSKTGRVPLALVDWHSGEAKFDQLYYISTVSVLYEAVASALRLPRVKSASDYQGYTKQLDHLEELLDLSEQPAWDGEAVRARLETNKADEIPFDFTDEEVTSVGAGFRDSIGQLVTEPLVRLEPYSALIEKYERNELVSGRLELWLGHDEQGKRIFEADGEQPSEVALPIANDVKDEYRLAYQVVFQKGFFEAAFALWDFADVLDQLWTGEDFGDVSASAFARAWSNVFNRRLASTLEHNPPRAALSPWLGAGLRLNGTIHYAAAAIGNIAHFTTAAMVVPVDGALAPHDEVLEYYRGELRRLGDSEVRHALEARAQHVGPIASWLEACAHESFGSDSYWDPDVVELWETLVPPYLKQIERFVVDRSRVRDEVLSDDEIYLATLAHAAVSLAGSV